MQSEVPFFKMLSHMRGRHPITILFSVPTLKASPENSPSLKRRGNDNAIAHYPNAVYLAGAQAPHVNSASGGILSQKTRKST